MTFVKAMILVCTVAAASDTAAGAPGTRLRTASIPTPVISPDSGTFSDSVQVSITCSEASATIRYTLDMSVPTDTSPQYTGPFWIRRTTTIMARAFIGPDTAGSDIDTVRLTVPKKVTLIYPNGGETLRTGDTITVRWTSNTNSAVLKLSVDGGLCFNRIIDKTAVVAADPDWCAYRWVIPPGIPDEIADTLIPVSSNRAMILVHDYMAPAVRDLSDRMFSIEPSAIRQPMGRWRPAARVLVPADARLFALSGEYIPGFLRSASDGSPSPLSAASLPAGLRILRFVDETGTPRALRVNAGASRPSARR